MHEFVRLAQKRDGFEVFASAVFVGNPLAFLPGIIEVDQRGHRIDAQSVEMVAVAPGQRVCDQEAPYLIAAVIKNERAPIHVRALPRVGVLVQMRTVELREREGVPREMRRHPVEDHPQAALVQVVDEEGETLRRDQSGASARRSR